ncbi:MAG: aldo/keto reductase [Archaeoglobaceae archaeon]
MEYLKIPKAGIKASRIGLGTQPMGDHQEELGIQTITSAIDQGINLIDTAPVYGRGRSEKIVGEALQHLDREELVVNTKTGLDYEREIVRDGTPERILKDIDTSLKRLNTDYVDVLQVHWPDPIHPLEDTAETMNKLLNEGKIRAIGVSNFNVEQMEIFSQNAEISTCQMPYNIFEREIERDVISYCQKNDITLLAYRSLCQGLLTGKLIDDTDYSRHSVKKDDPKFKPPRYQQYLQAVRELDEIAKEHGRGVLDLAINWILANDNTVALWGAWKPEYLHEANDVLGWEIDRSLINRVDKVVNENVKDPVGPEFLAPPTRK